MEGRKIPVQHELVSPKNPHGCLSCFTTERVDHVFLPAVMVSRGYRNLFEHARNLCCRRRPPARPPAACGRADLRSLRGHCCRNRPQPIGVYPGRAALPRIHAGGRPGRVVRRRGRFGAAEPQCGAAHSSGGCCLHFVERLTGGPERMPIAACVGARTAGANSGCSNARVGAVSVCGGFFCARRVPAPVGFPLEPL